MNKLPGTKSKTKSNFGNKNNNRYFNPYTTNATTKQSEINNLGEKSRTNKTRVTKNTGGISYKDKEKSSRKKVLEKKQAMKTSSKKPKTTIQKTSKVTAQKRIEKKHKQRIRKRKQIVAIAKLMIVVLGTTIGILAVFNIGDNLKGQKISYQTVKMGNIDNSIPLQGVILRNEEVIYGENSTNIRYVVTEGEKVKKDGMVYVIVDQDNLETSVKEQSEINKHIYDKAEQRENISYYQDDIYNINETLSNDFNEFYDNRYQETTNFVYTLRSKLEKSIKDRTNVYTKEQKDVDEPIIAQKEVIENNIDKYQVGKTAPQAGIISYKIDGKETLNASEAISNMNYDNYKILENNKDIKENKELKEPIYKIILNNKWYIVSYIDKDNEHNFKEGESYNLYFEHNTKELQFKLKSKIDENDTRIKLVFETSDQISEFLDARNVKFSIGDRSVSGIKVPRESIVEQNMIKVPLSYADRKDSKYGVYRQVGDVSQYVEIEVEYKYDDYLYVRQDIGDLNKLQVNEILIVPPINNKIDQNTEYKLDMIETIQGVYVINGGISEFKTISIELLSSEYAIIDTEGITELKVGDKIISNPKSVGVDQLIKDMDIQNQ